MLPRRAAIDRQLTAVIALIGIRAVFQQSLDNVGIAIPIQSGQTFSGTATFTATVQGFALEEINDVSGTIDAQGAVSGTLAGDLFGLPGWTTGLAYAYLEGVGDEPGAVQDSNVWEAYARWDAAERFALSADLQRVGDRLRGDENPRLWAIGLRFHYAL